MDFRDTINAEIERASGEIDKARRLLNEAKTRHDTLVAVLAKYDESSHNGHRPVAQTETPTAPVEAPSGGAVVSQPTDEADNKAAHVRAFFVQNRVGVTPREVKAAMLSQGLIKNEAYVYSIINRLKLRGRLEVRRGKYYPTTKLLNEELGLEALTAVGEHVLS